MNGSADVRWQQRFESFDRALTLLSAALQAGPAALNQLEKEGAFQRFEYTLEFAWKTFKIASRCNRWNRSGICLCGITSSGLASGSIGLAEAALEHASGLVT